MQFLVLVSYLFFAPLFAFSAIEHAIVSVYAVHCDSNEVLLSENCNISLIPASCLKVVTTAAALHLLGPQSRFETLLEYNGHIDEVSTLHGNIYIRGGGDPCLGSNRISSALPW